jgi:hypothetical protein
MKVLLISANTERISMVTMPLGLGLVAAALRRAGPGRMPRLFLAAPVTASIHARCFHTVQRLRFKAGRSAAARRAWARNENAIATAKLWNKKMKTKGHITEPAVAEK